MSNVQNGRVAILWRGDRATREAATPQNNRYRRIFEELQALGIHAEPAVYADDLSMKSGNSSWRSMACWFG
jgi:hypothetical protein